MKVTKKLFALLMALVMIMGLGLTASAADITIKNAADGETYTAYKLFDVSIARDEEDNATSYSYYIENTDANEGLINLLDNTIGLKLELSADGSRYNVSTNEDNTAFLTDGEDAMSPADLAKELNIKISGLTSAGSGTAANSIATISVADEGYYFVDTTLGSLCILNTTGAEIYEKNTIPEIEKKVKEDSKTEGEQWQDTATIDVTDTIVYQLTVNTGTNEKGTATGVDGNYVITDVLPVGITYNEGTVAIAGWTLNTDFTVNYVPGTQTGDTQTGDTVEITLLSSGKLAALGKNADIVITYNAKVAENVNLTVDKDYTNTVTLSYKEQESTDTAIVKTYDIDGDAEGNTFTKVEAGSSEPLAGVKFVLSKTVVVNEEDTVKYATFDEDKYLTGWVNSMDDATELVTDANGHIYAYGLDADTYVLTETETLPGYNLLNDTITVTIDENGAVTYKLTSSEESAENTIEVVNKTGALLPSTGGMGTTVIYIIGAVLVIGAGIVLVVRRRTNA